MNVLHSLQSTPKPPPQSRICSSHSLMLRTSLRSVRGPGGRQLASVAGRQWQAAPPLAVGRVRSVLRVMKLLAAVIHLSGHCDASIAQFSQARHLANTILLLVSCSDSIPTTRSWAPKLPSPSSCLPRKPGQQLRARHPRQPPQPPSRRPRSRLTVFP